MYWDICLSKAISVKPTLFKSFSSLLLLSCLPLVRDIRPLAQPRDSKKKLTWWLSVSNSIVPSSFDINALCWNADFKVEWTALAFTPVLLAYFNLVWHLKYCRANGTRTCHSVMNLLNKGCINFLRLYGCTWFALILCLAYAFVLNLFFLSWHYDYIIPIFC